MDTVISGVAMEKKMSMLDTVLPWAQNGNHPGKLTILSECAIEKIFDRLYWPTCEGYLWQAFQWQENQDQS